jgi:hypothetical protein
MNELSQGPSSAMPVKLAIESTAARQPPRIHEIATASPLESKIPRRPGAGCNHPGSLEIRFRERLHEFWYCDVSGKMSEPGGCRHKEHDRN